ncbi:NADPH-dependent FMN reductase [Pseudofrankia asymbiotica]|uniref:NADPH-dependent FMN reductase n=1 Tax=Pseudofrankia asymbiotica TaxID=1834516 RepID=UPI001F5282CA|nr:NADPH-dependent FMN reductase [Pseudofrankia asymbiotica]
MDGFGTGPSVVRDSSPLTVRRGKDASADRIPPPGLERRNSGHGPGQSGRRRPLIVGIGGSARIDSPTMRALGAAARMLAQAGAETVMLSVAELDLPPYQPDGKERSAAVRRLVSEVRRAEGLVIAAPDYHGGTSGALKNALDYLWDLGETPRPGLDARPVGLLACDEGPGAGGALATLRATVHALGGWPTPLGVSLNRQECATIDQYGAISSPAIAGRFDTLTDQIMGFAYAWSHLI